MAGKEGTPSTLKRFVVMLTEVYYILGGKYTESCISLCDYRC